MFFQVDKFRLQADKFRNNVSDIMAYSRVLHSYIHIYLYDNQANF